MVNNGRAAGRAAVRSGADSPGRPRGKPAWRGPGGGGGSDGAGAPGALRGGEAPHPRGGGSSPQRSGQHGTRPPDPPTARRGAVRPGPVRGGDGGVGSPRGWTFILAFFPPFSLLFSLTFISPFIFSLFPFFCSFRSLSPFISLSLRSGVPQAGARGRARWGSPWHCAEAHPRGRRAGGSAGDAGSRLRAREAIPCGRRCAGEPPRRT